MKEVIVRELILDETTGWNALAIVDSPAIMEDFVFFSDNGIEKVTQRIKFKEADQMMMYGPVLIPDIKIKRAENFFVTMSKETIRKAVHSYMKSMSQTNNNLQHTTPVEGLTVVEMWVKDFNEDKSVGLGFDLPIGTAFVGMKCDNEEVWKEVKAGTFKGFSIEATFKTGTDTTETVDETEEFLMDIEELLK